MNDTQISTASAARSQLYTLIKEASEGKLIHEIHLRGSKPVVLLSKDELEGLLETIDVLTSPEEMSAIRKGRRETTSISHEELVRMITLNDSGNDGN